MDFRPQTWRISSTAKVGSHKVLEMIQMLLLRIILSRLHCFINSKKITFATSAELEGEAEPQALAWTSFDN